MCGIFAYVGSRKNTPKLVIEGLKKLEYRGYDSWGIAFKTGKEISIYKEVGRIGDFDPDELVFDSTHSQPQPASQSQVQQASQRPQSTSRSAQQFSSKQPLQTITLGEVEENLFMAIAHTRWATHGGISHKNAHPHATENKEVVLVHNGILENYEEIKKRLEKLGHKFSSETDTEVIAHLIEEHLMHSKNFQSAVEKAVQEMEGRYAIVTICEKENTLIAARKGSPLIIGKGDNEYFIASDIPAFLQYTNKVMYLDDNQFIVIKESSTKKPEAKFFDMNTLKEVKKRVIEINFTPESAEKGEYPHFLIKEIMEQKECLHRAINQDPETITQAAKAIKEAFGAYFIGCGTTGKVAMVGQYLFADIAHRHVNATFGSEFSNYKCFLKDRSLLVTISQSGETADTLEAIEIAKAKGTKVMSIVNVESSTMARISDIVIPIKVGPEKAVVSTKATTAQIAILTLLAYACDGGIEKGKKLLIDTASQINDMLNPRYEAHLLKLSKKLKKVESMYLIGRGKNYPIALEGAIKIHEVTYIHAEGFAGGELKHGPIALIAKGTPCIAIVANDETKKEILANASELKARGAYIIGIAPENNKCFDYWIRVPDASHASPIVNIIPIQILAYQLAVLLKNDPDKPRNLAKSVTVK